MADLLIALVALGGLIISFYLYNKQKTTEALVISLMINIMLMITLILNLLIPVQ